MPDKKEQPDSNMLEILTGALMAILSIIIILWGILLLIPSIQEHRHTDSCYTKQGELACGKEDGELYFTKSKVPTYKEALDYLSAKEDERIKQMDGLSMQEKLEKDIPFHVVTALLLLICFVMLYKDHKKGKGSSQQ